MEDIIEYETSWGIESKTDIQPKPVFSPHKILGDDIWYQFQNISREYIINVVDIPIDLSNIINQYIDGWSGCSTQLSNLITNLIDSTDDLCDFGDIIISIIYALNNLNQDNKLKNFPYVRDAIIPYNKIKSDDDLYMLGQYNICESGKRKPFLRSQKTGINHYLEQQIVFEVKPWTTPRSLYAVIIGVIMRWIKYFQVNINFINESRYITGADIVEVLASLEEREYIKIDLRDYTVVYLA
ncbi:MAG: hypothetical protein Solumvirus2_56 [Solumvirus sp.]|uniref:Uncharacterized protein n=1 Tax=Solumvirus sp. TaxID=2487773 RepID=A0A3G5AKB0_9VIRU|nr:MAG: hypothetical protein Solumvirus2_56 [Solumvirus sp.]